MRTDTKMACMIQKIIKYAVDLRISFVWAMFVAVFILACTQGATSADPIKANMAIAFVAVSIGCLCFLVLSYIQRRIELAIDAKNCLEAANA